MDHPLFSILWKWMLVYRTKKENQLRVYIYFVDMNVNRKRVVREHERTEQNRTK